MFKRRIQLYNIVEDHDFDTYQLKGLRLTM